MPPKLSAFIITKDEEDKIARCLEHLRWVDEIIIFDSCSADKTIEIAKKFTKKIYKMIIFFLVGWQFLFCFNKPGEIYKKNYPFCRRPQFRWYQ